MQKVKHNHYCFYTLIIIIHDLIYYLWRFYLLKYVYHHLISTDIHLMISSSCVNHINQNTSHNLMFNTCLFSCTFIPTYFFNELGHRKFKSLDYVGNVANNVYIFSKRLNVRSFLLFLIILGK
jgi:hypothetical protein